MKQETLLKIIGLLRKNLKKGLTIFYISKTLKIGYRPAYNHITEMGKQGIITINKIGNSKQCFLNLDNDKCRHLLEELDMQTMQDLSKKNLKLKNILETLTSRLTEVFISEIHSIVLFGSYAKGTALKSSDIDLLFIVSDIKNKKLRENIERECASLQYSYSIKISPIITDIPELKRMLALKELNIGKETREYGISVYGSEKFWRIVA